MAKPQDALDSIWDKYRKSLNDLSNALDENEVLKSDADIDFSTPSDIAELEAKVEEKIAQHGIA
jgi:hypothetical protein|tara:strand:+ start:441 stop:632 length:192 start_codon:yes stop_codon:yes gene_type:complete